jgi:WD repeat-containing protein 70
MEDSGEIYDGVRAEFPLSFGKQSKSQTPLETIHKATRRTTSTSSNDFPSISSSSSKEWLHSIRPPKNPTPPSPPQDDDSPLVGPPPPPPRHEADDEEDDGEMIGPPPPPPRSNFDDSEDEEEDSDKDELENRFRIPLSNEIVLKGHTKVLSSFLPLSFFFLCFFRILISWKIWSCLDKHLNLDHMNNLFL